jgi:hypothetical protein
MNERECDLSRRDFLKLSATVAAAATLPKILVDLNGDLNKDLPESDIKRWASPDINPIKKEYSVAKEEEPQKGPRIIDTIGIKRGNNLVDVETDKTLMRENILARAKLMVSPELYPKVEEKVDKLTISFGSRSIEDVLETEVDRNDSNDSKGGVSLRGWLYSRFSKIELSNDITLGQTYSNIKEPLIYMNTAEIPDDLALRYVWDHETAHLINRVDPKRRESALEDFSKYIGLTVPFDAVLSLGTTLTASNLYSKIKDIDLRTLIERNKDKFITANLGLFIAGWFPSAIFAEDIQYYYGLDKKEINAEKAVHDFPTSDDQFNKMIRVVPREEMGSHLSNNP